MNLSINSNVNNIAFNARYTKLAKENMDKTLFPLLKRSDMNIKKMAEESKFTNHAICKWFQETFGVTPAAYFKNKEQETLKNELFAFYNNKIPVDDIAKHYGLTRRWVYDQFTKFKIKTSREELNAMLDNEVLNLIHQGYPMDSIAKKINCSETTLQKWLNKNIPQGVVKYRHDNNIELNHGTRNTKDFIVSMIEESFNAGNSIKETADLYNLKKDKVLRIKQKHKLKTNLEHAQALLDNFLPDFIKDNESLKVMSRIVGLSKATIARKIRAIYGKNYIDIRMNR